MENIFLGFIFVMLDFNLTLGKCILGILPDFIGYFFILRGLRRLADKSQSMRNLIIPDMIITLISFIFYLMDLFTVSVRLPYIISLLLSAFNLAVFLYIAYQVVQGVLEMERRTSQQLYGDALLLRWQIIAVLSVLIYLLSVLPVLFLIVVLCNLVASILFLAALNRTKNMYLAQNK